MIFLSYFYYSIYIILLYRKLSSLPLLPPWLYAMIMIILSFFLLFLFLLPLYFGEIYCVQHLFYLLHWISLVKFVQNRISLFATFYFVNYFWNFIPVYLFAFWTSLSVEFFLHLSISASSINFIICLIICNSFIFILVKPLKDKNLCWLIIVWNSST